MTFNQQTLSHLMPSHLMSNQRKRIIIAVVALVFIGAGTTSYAGHDDYSDEIVAGALIGAVVGLSLVSHNDRYDKHYDRHRKHQKYHFHGDHRCYKRHKARKRHHQHYTSYNGHHNGYHSGHHNNNHRGYQHGHSQHSHWQHKKRRADREVHHYYNDQRSKRQSSHSKHQSKRQSSHQSNEGYVSVRHF